MQVAFHKGCSLFPGFEAKSNWRQKQERCAMGDWPMCSGGVQPLRHRYEASPLRCYFVPKGQKDRPVIGTSKGKLGPSGNIQASFWSANKSGAGRGGLPGCEYQTFPASTGGSASICNNRKEVIMCHREITTVPQRSISWSAGPGYVTFKTGGHVPITQGTICKFLSTSWPQGATRAIQLM